jgi:hypothetical protein
MQIKSFMKVSVKADRKYREEVRERWGEKTLQRASSVS